MVGLWIAAGAVALSLAALGWILWTSVRIPRSIPEPDRPLFRAALEASRAELGPGVLSDAIPSGLHRHDAHVYAAFFVLFRDLCLADGLALTRNEREILATSVSVSNTCHYCSHIHGALVRAREQELVERIFAGQPERISDPRQRALATYGLEARHAGAAILTAPPFTAEEASDAAIVVVSFHYINRILDALGPRGMSRALIVSPPRRLLASVMGLDRSIEGGIALPRLLASGLTPPIELDASDRAHIARWTLGRPEAADAVAFAWSMIQHAARELFAPEVLETIRAHLAGWRGEDTDLSDPWLERAVAGLASAPHSQELVRQALVVAREPFRIDQGALTRATGGDPRRRLALVAFTACAVALRIGEWLVIPGTEGGRSSEGGRS